MISKTFDISIIVCTGSPRRKHDVLSTCFQKLGFSLGMHIQPNPETIDLLLLEDLGHSLGILPNRWMESDASLRAREKINKFISQTAMLTGKRLLLDVNPLTLPLWIDVFQNHGIQVKFIHILRHPYEVALSLQDNQNLELQQGHILWLSYTHSAMNALKGQDCFFITVDQLLADPVSTCNNALNYLLLSDVSSLPSDILADVQPSIKKHHVYNLSDADQLTFKPYANLYYQIRGMYNPISEKIKRDNQLTPSGSLESDLIDSLLKAFGCFAGHCLNVHSSSSVASNSFMHESDINRIISSIRDKNYTVRTIHHLSSSGGTLISKCLSAMPDVVMLSEINPCSAMGGLLFDPFDPLKHFQKAYPEISYKDADSFKLIFYERIKWVIEKCKEHQRSLIIRDHSHSDFLFQGVLEQPPVYTFLNELYNVIPIITLRNPIDSYLSMMVSFPQATDIKSFEEYCQRILMFIKKYSFSEIFLYEDFVDNPDRTLQRMCEIYEIEYDPSYKDKFYKIILTGDSGRGSKQRIQEIKRLDRREYSQDFFQEVKESVSFKQICELVGYQDDLQPPK